MSELDGEGLLGELQKSREELAKVTNERDHAIALLANWCVDIDRNGTSWDDWDEHYKQAAYRPIPIRELLDKAIDDRKKHLQEMFR